jgi:soluble lytic murein transglycosylase
MMERPGIADDEFIDDIPYPQTNNYVKKILGTAEDYRRLYGPGSVRVDAVVAEATPAVSNAAAAEPAKTGPRPTARKTAPVKSPAKKKTRKAA